jgi:hypothetical protein
MVSSSLLIVDDEWHDLIPQAFLHHLLTDAFPSERGHGQFTNQHFCSNTNNSIIIQEPWKCFDTKRLCPATAIVGHFPYFIKNKPEKLTLFRFSLNLLPLY